MMSKVKVLFLAADPRSELRLDVDVREIRQKVRGAEYRDALDFDYRLAARPDDLIQALNEVRPRVVHFSGHGRTDGLVLVGEDGRLPRLVPAAALAQLFKVFRGDIGVVVLNACFSLPQAEAIAETVGCAIGTRRAISDPAAITFSAAFYRALAFGRSVQEAFDQAQVALALQYPREQDCPHIVHRDDVDPSRLILVAPEGADTGEPGPANRAASEKPPLENASPEPGPPVESRAQKARPAWGAKRITTAIAALVLSSTALIAGQDVIDWPWETNGPRPATLASLEPAEGSLADARALYEARNYAAALPIFQRAAEAGDHEAMGFLGMMLLNGEGTARQPVQAVQWLEEAAEARDARGMTWLGVAYERGEGKRRRYYLAKHWYEAAVREKSYGEAMRNLGRLYQFGLGVKRNDTTALDWYHKAVDAGFVDANVSAGRMYEEGLGTPRDPQKAAYFYHEGAKAGASAGMLEMGRIYEKGIGVPQDYGQARAWYTKAAEAGSAEAMNSLGLLYYHGLGVQRDRGEAIRWFRKAAAAGSTVAQGNLDTLNAD